MRRIVMWLASSFVTCAAFALLVVNPRAASAAPETTVVVGSKIFTESYVLGEIAAQSLELKSNQKVGRKLGMGSTGILFESLRTGAIDVYPDYTGTLAEAILKKPELKSNDEIRAALGKFGLVMSEPLGFNNTYALAVRDEFAEKNGLRTIDDLAKVAGSLRAAFSYEFIERQDGYRGLMKRYGLEIKSENIKRLEHSLAFQAIADGATDLIDVYTTDAKIQTLKLRVLQDNRRYFPLYQAVWVATEKFVAANPDAWRVLRSFEGTISANKMISLNAEADVEKLSYQKIAAKFLGKSEVPDETVASRIQKRTLEHLWLVGISLVFSIVIGIPLGILASRYARFGQSILILSAVVQTIPSLALLCFLIPVFGVGAVPALVALCLYSLLPVVLNTFTGIRSIDSRHIENAMAFGLSRRRILWNIILPLASPTILAGVKTATIVSIGTATLAALVGAGGYGAPILSGLSLNDIPTILMGAVPAAIMALLAYVLFEVLARLLISPGLRR